MAGQALTNVGVWMDQYDLSGQLRGVAVEYMAELKDQTTFGSTTRKAFPTTRMARASVEGLWTASSTNDGAPDKALYTNIQTEGTIVSCANVRTEGGRAFTFQGAQANYTVGDRFGEITPFSANFEQSASPNLVRGYLLADVSGATSTSVTTKYQTGAISAGQRLYAALHVLSVSGTSPTLDVVVQSDADASAGGETSRITFSQATDTANRAQWSSVAGAVTDTYWRTSYTIGGSATPTFSFVVVIGVL